MTHRKLAVITVAVALPVVVGFMFVSSIQAQSKATAPEPLVFEVVSIKPNSAPAGPTRFVCHALDSGMPPGSAPALGRCSVARNTLQMLIATSYAMDLAMVKGGPPWTSSDLFDVETKAEDPSKTTRNMIGLMLQSFLADRFKLIFHRESVEVPGYVLTVAKGGSKLKTSEVEDAHAGISGANSGPITSRHWFISRLALTLSKRLGQPVVDETNLAGAYDFTLSWGDGAGGFGGERGGPSVFTAIQEQLGLKLESQKVAAESIVIDHVEKPVLN